MPAGPPPRSSPNIRPGPQSRPDILRALQGKRRVAAIKYDRVILTPDEVFHPGCFLRCHYIQFILQSVAELVKGEIVFISAERILDFTPNSCDGQDDVRSDNRAGDGNPPESMPELEWQHDDVHPRDLRDGYAIGDR